MESLVFEFELDSGIRHDWQVPTLAVVLPVGVHGDARACRQTVGHHTHRQQAGEVGYLGKGCPAGPEAGPCWYRFALAVSHQDAVTVASVGELKQLPRQSQQVDA